MRRNTGGDLRRKYTTEDLGVTRRSGHLGQHDDDDVGAVPLVPGDNGCAGSDGLESATVFEVGSSGLGVTGFAVRKESTSESAS